MLLLSGMPTAFTSTFGHGAGAVGNALGLLLLLNAAAHGLTLACQVTGDRVWVLAPTADWADRPPWPLAVHFVAGLLFALFGVWSLLVANDDTVDWIGCPSDAAALATHLAPGAEPPLMSRLSLVDLHQCAKQQERLADSAAATLSLQHEAFASQRQYALSLSLLLCLDGGLCLLAAYVVYGGRQVGAIRPPDPADNSRTTAQMSDDAGMPRTISLTTRTRAMREAVVRRNGRGRRGRQLGGALGSWRVSMRQRSWRACTLSASPAPTWAPSTWRDCSSRGERSRSWA